MIVRLYQKVERPKTWTPDALQIVRDAGKMCAGYWWPYHGSDVRSAFTEVCNLAQNCGGLDVAYPFADIETYTDGTIPNAQEIEDIADEAQLNFLMPAFYSSPPMWAKAGNPQINDGVGWGAKYINKEPADLSGAPHFGDLKMIGWQWTSSPLDRSLFVL